MRAKQFLDIYSFILK